MDSLGKVLHPLSLTSSLSLFASLIIPEIKFDLSLQVSKLIYPDDNHWHGGGWKKVAKEEEENEWKGMGHTPHMDIMKKQDEKKVRGMKKRIHVPRMLVTQVKHFFHSLYLIYLILFLLFSLNWITGSKFVSAHFKRRSARFAAHRSDGEWVRRRMSERERRPRDERTKLSPTQFHIQVPLSKHIRIFLWVLSCSCSWYFFCRTFFELEPATFHIPWGK